MHWKTFEAVENPPGHFTREERSSCYFLYDYNPDADFGNEAKSKITNFKKDPVRASIPELQHKERAIKEFAHYLASAFIPNDEAENDYAIIIPIPSSIPKGNDGYDDRFERLGLFSERNNPLVKFQYSIQIAENQGHTRTTNRRNPSTIKENLVWTDLEEGIRSSYIYLVDDVITSGSHFRACKDFILENIGFDCHVGGLFFARTNRNI